jgi:hypothetical protein
VCQLPFEQKRALKAASSTENLAKTNRTEYKHCMSEAGVLVKSVLDRLPPDGWEVAGKAVTSLGPIFPPLAAYVRVLNTPFAGDGRGKIHKDTVLLAFLRTPTLREGIRQFIENFYPRRLPTHRALTPADITGLVDYELCAAFVTLLHLYRKVKQAVPNREQWQALAELVHDRADIGYYLGQSLPGFGGALGLLVGGARFLSQGYIATRDPVRYHEYEQHLRANALTFDVAYEVSKWGFSHTQFVAFYLQRMGYTRDIPLSIATGLSSTNNRANVTALAAKIQAVSAWIEVIVRDSPPPPTLGEAQFGLSGTEISQLLKSVRTMAHSQTAILWLEPKHSG